MDEDRVKTSSAPSLYGKNSEIGAKKVKIKVSKPLIIIFTHQHYYIVAEELYHYFALLPKLSISNEIII